MFDGIVMAVTDKIVFTRLVVAEMALTDMYNSRNAS